MPRRAMTGSAGGTPSSIAARRTGSKRADGCLVRDVTARVGAWVDAHLGELSDRSPVSVHLDALGGSWEAGDVEMV